MKAEGKAGSGLDKGKMRRIPLNILPSQLDVVVEFREAAGGLLACGRGERVETMQRWYMLVEVEAEED